MDQSDIMEKTKEILALNDNPEQIHEFCAACANAKAIVENKLQSEVMKTTIAASMKHLINSMGLQ